MAKAKRKMTLEDFEWKYGTVLVTALRAYAEQQRQAAAPLRAEFERTQHDPVLAAKYDEDPGGSWITTRGMEGLSAQMEQNAQLADDAMEAWSELTEDEE